jgi:hypothetical protein
MTLIVLSREGVPFGVGAHTFWARSHIPLPPHEQRTLEQRESRHWTELQRAFEKELSNAGATCTPWYQMDREADASHVLLRGLEPNQLFTVRANRDRLLSPVQKGHGRKALRKLREKLLETPTLGVTHLDVLRHRHRTERVARMEVTYAAVSVRLRERWSHKLLADVPIVAVWAHEVGTTPAGEEPIEWLLLTNYPVRSFEDACKVVQGYAHRWVTERVNYTWKSGACNVEDSQLESFESLARWGTLHLSVAVHAQEILALSRTQPDLPADEVFPRDQIDAALTLYRTHSSKAPPLGSTPTLGQLVLIISRLGGYAGSSKQRPGIKTFLRGLRDVLLVSEAFRIAREAGPLPPTPTHLANA